MRSTFNVLINGHIVISLKLWVALARQNFKWMKMVIRYLGTLRVYAFTRGSTYNTLRNSHVKQSEIRYVSLVFERMDVVSRLTVDPQIMHWQQSHVTHVDKVSELLYVVFCTIMAISRQMEARSREHVDTSK